MCYSGRFFCRILSASCTTDNVCFGRPNLNFKEVHYYEHRQIKNTQNGHARHDGCHRRCHLTYSENRGYVPYCTPDKHRLFRTSGTVVFTSLCHSHRNHPVKNGCGYSCEVAVEGNEIVFNEIVPISL